MLLAEKLTKQYGSHTALHDLDLEVAPGEIFCLLGANGAGKTTTINLFMGFDVPTSGRASIDGRLVVSGDQSIRSLTGYIPENVMLYPELTGLQNLAYFAGLSGKKYAEAQLVHFLTEAGLPPDAVRQRVGQYSKGMRQKVGIALVVAKEAKVLFLDEPTSGLDPLASNEFSRLLLRLSDQGVAILMVTHDLFRAKETAHRIGIMRAGHLVEIIETKQITHRGLEDAYITVGSRRHETQ
jgi:ABC-2 type transport system ATP-binding protein